MELPERARKPREEGLTHVIDGGLSTAEAEGLMASAGDYVDLVRLGWGSAYVTHDLQAKIACYRSAGVPVMLGGTLTELAWLQGRVEQLVPAASSPASFDTTFDAVALRAGQWFLRHLAMLRGTYNGTGASYPSIG